MDSGDIIVYSLLYAVVVTLIVVIYVQFFRKIPNIIKRQDEINERLKAVHGMQEAVVRDQDNQIVTIASRVPLLVKKINVFDEELSTLKARNAELARNLNVSSVSNSNVAVNFKEYEASFSNQALKVSAIIDEDFERIAKEFQHNGKDHEKILSSLDVLDTQFRVQADNLNNLKTRVNSLDSNLNNVIGVGLCNLAIDYWAFRGQYTGNMDQLNQVLNANAIMIEKDKVSREQAIKQTISSMNESLNSKTSQLDSDFKRELEQIPGIKTAMDQVQNTYMLQQGDAKVLNSKFDGYNNIANMLQAGVNDNTRSNVVRGLSLSRVEDRVQQIQDINNAQTRDITTIAGINQTQMSSLNDLAVKDRDQDAMVSMVGLYNTVHSAGIDNMNDKTTRAASKLDSIDANNIKTATLNMIQGLQLSDLYKRVLGGG